MYNIIDLIPSCLRFYCGIHLLAGISTEPDSIILLIENKYKGYLDVLKKQIKTENGKTAKLTHY